MGAAGRARCKTQAGVQLGEASDRRLVAEGAVWSSAIVGKRPVKLRGFWPDAATYQAAVSGDRAAAPRNLIARVESSLRDEGPSTTVPSVATLDSTPNGVCGALGKANVECEDGRYRLADDE